MIYCLLLLLFLASTICSYGYICYAWRKNWLDIPNIRSSHSQLTPRGGGMVFINLWLIASLVALFLQQWTLAQAAVLLPGTLLVAWVGFCDDRYNLAARWRALAYLLAAILSVVALGGFNQLIINSQFSLPLGLFGSFLAVLAILWSTNLFNFMDGLDGLAATEALFILTIGGFFMAQAGGYAMAVIAWLLAVCVGGFLVWNKPPAKIFMGDMGSATLGFVVMVLALLGEKYYGVPVLLWAILYGVFVVDTTLTLLRRLWAKEPIYQAHRLHANQRLHQAGFSHKKVLIIISSINVALMLLAILGFYNRDYLLIYAGLALVMLLILYGWVERIKPMYNTP